MYQCSWLVNKVQCSNRTNNLVCIYCKDEKNRLYTQYKEAEKTVISALSNPSPRGDLLEVSKVIGRISRVVKLRRKFTSSIATQARDPGHEYHVSKLLGVMMKYERYLQFIVQENDKEESDETSVTSTNEIIASSITLSHEIGEVVKEDPFAEFDNEIKAYHTAMRDLEQLRQQASDILKLSGENFNLICSFYYHLCGIIGFIDKSLSHLLKGYSLSVKVTKRNVKLDPYPSELLAVVDNANNIDHDLIRWLLENFGVAARLILTRRRVNGENMIIIAFKAGTVIYPHAIRLSIRMENGQTIVLTNPVPLDQESMNVVRTYKSLFMGRKIKY